MKRARILAWFVACLLCSSLALGSRETHKSVIPIPDVSKEKNRFWAALLLSDQPEDVLRSWANPGSAVPVHTTDTITRGVPIVAFVFFSGCQPDERGLCNASADFTILKPDGSVYASFSNRELWKGKPAPPEGTFRLSAEYVGAVIEPQDPLGRYEFRVSVHDLNAGTTIELTQAFTATSGQEKP